MTFDEFLREACLPLGLEWRMYRRRSARHLIEARIRELGLASFASYLERLACDQAELPALPDRMRVRVSRFFRDRECWKLLATKVVPVLLADKTVTDPFRAWSVGRCGGEEPYSLAILALESFVVAG